MSEDFNLLKAQFRVFDHAFLHKKLTVGLILVQNVLELTSIVQNLHQDQLRIIHESSLYGQKEDLLLMVLISLVADLEANSADNDIALLGPLELDVVEFFLFLLNHFVHPQVDDEVVPSVHLQFFLLDLQGHHDQVVVVGYLSLVKDFSLDYFLVFLLLRINVGNLI